MNKKSDPLEETKKLIQATFPDDNVLAHIDDLINFIKAKKISWTADETSMTLAIAFLNEADRDIDSCRALYSKKIYSHSVYHLQQAVEKAMKGYCLGLGILSIQDVGGHYTPYVFLKGMFEKTGMKELIQGLSEESENLIDKAWEAEGKPDKRLEIARMPFEQIIRELSRIDNYKLISNQVVRSLSMLMTDFKGKAESPPLEIATLSIMTSLYILGAVSFPHEAFTRYPDGKMTPTDYIRELGIVKAIPKMLDYLAPVVKQLRHHLSQK